VERLYLTIWKTYFTHATALLYQNNGTPKAACNIAQASG